MRVDFIKPLLFLVLFSFSGHALDKEIRQEAFRKPSYSYALEVTPEKPQRKCCSLSQITYVGIGGAVLGTVYGLSQLPLPWWYWATISCGFTIKFIYDFKTTKCMYY